MPNMYRKVDEFGKRLAVTSAFIWLLFFASVVLSFLLGAEPHNYIVLSLGIVCIALICITVVLAILGSLGGKTSHNETT